MSHRPLFVSVALAAMLCCRVSEAQGQRSQLQQEMAKLLEVGWQRTVKAAPAVLDQYERLRRLVPRDARVPYAYALVQVRQRRFRQASKLADEAIALNERDWHSWRAKIWISMLTRNYSGAMVEMDLLSRLLPAVDADQEEVERTYGEIAAFLGRQFGFMAGPANRAPSEKLTADHQNRIVARLTDSRRAAFEQARRSVLERFASMKQQADRIDNEAKASRQKKEQEADSELEKEREELTSKLVELDARRKNLRGELKEDLERIEKEQRPLLRSLDRLREQAAVTEYEGRLILDEIFRLQILAERQSDPLLRDYLYRDALRLEILLSDYDVDIWATNRELFRMQARGADALALRDTARSDYGAERKRLEDDEARVRRDGRRLKVKQRRSRRSSRRKLVGASALRVKAKAFTTYEPFPLEQERQRLLGSFR